MIDSYDCGADGMRDNGGARRLPATSHDNVTKNQNAEHSTPAKIACVERRDRQTFVQMMHQTVTGASPPFAPSGLTLLWQWTRDIISKKVELFFFILLFVAVADSTVHFVVVSVAAPLVGPKLTCVQVSEMLRACFFVKISLKNILCLCPAPNLACRALVVALVWIKRLSCHQVRANFYW